MLYAPIASSRPSPVEQPVIRMTGDSLEDILFAMLRMYDGLRSDLLRDHIYDVDAPLSPEPVSGK